MRRLGFYGKFQLIAICFLTVLCFADSGGESENEYTYTEKLISAKKGGVIKIADRCTVVIPPKALDSDTVLTLEAFTTVETIGDNKIDMMFKFGPSPLQFSKNVFLTFPWDDYYEGAGDIVYLYYYDPEDGEWEKKDATVIDVPGNRIVTYQVDHFSRYALAGPSKAM
jgi:hypothetical protein